MLTYDPVVEINVSVGAAVQAGSGFNVGAILGPSSVITAANRYAEYASPAAMLEGTTHFAITDPEYLAAVKYFGCSPAPDKVVVIFYGSTETPAAALQDAYEKGASFYGVYYCPTSTETAANIKTNIIAIDQFLNTISYGMQFYGVTGTKTEVIASGGLFDTMYEANSERSVGMKCLSDTSDAAGLMGVAMGLALKFENAAFALAYKAIPGASIDNTIDQDDIDDIKEVNGNVYVQRTRAHQCFENGATGCGLRFDEVFFIDRMAHDLQEACFALVAGYEGKLPLNDSTTTLLLTEINAVLEQYYNAGVLATSVWRGADIGDIETGDTVEHGYLAFADSFDTQSDADRALRKAMPITVLLCLSGSVETVQLNLFVQT